MPDQYDLLFLKTAFDKGYIDQKIANYLLDYLKECECRGKSLKLIDSLIYQARSGGKSFLSPAQIAEIQGMITLSQTDHLTNNARNIEFPDDSAEMTVAYGDADVPPHDNAEMTVTCNEINAGESEITAVHPSTKSIGSGKFQALKGMFAHYDVQKELGKGGMGIVYKAYDTRLKRIVALKVLLQNEDVAKTQLQRFIREARSLAQIDHQNVIRVFDVGDFPQPYFTMEYIEGEDLAAKIRKGETKPLHTAKLLKKVASALYFVHEHGIVHRDIKPSNIMIQKDGEPKLMDFGLAKTEDANLSRSGDFLGTPAYMPPEQVNNLAIDGRTDIYSLGATLYQALTGRGPFQGDTVYNIIYQICNKDPVSPRQLNPDINPDLEAICLKCMEKSPRKRYANARILSRDLQNFIEQRPVMAKPATSFTLIKKWVVRNRAVSFVSAISLFFLVLGVTAYILNQRSLLAKANDATLNAKKNEKIAKEARKLAEEREIKLEENTREISSQNEEIKEKTSEIEASLYIAKISLAKKYSEQYDIALATKVLDECPEKLRHWEWYLLKDQMHEERQSIAIKIPNDGNRPVQNKSCMFSPDGNSVLVMAEVEAGDEVFKREIITMDSDLRILRRVQIANSSTPYAFSPDGKFFAYAKREGKKKMGREALIIELATGEIVFRQRHKNPVFFCAFDPKGKKLLVVTVCRKYYGRLTIWNLEKNRQIQSFKDEIMGLDEINYCAFSPDGEVIAYCCHYKDAGYYRDVIKLWRWNSDKPPRELSRRHKGTIHGCVFVPGRQFLISISDDHRIIVWDLTSGDLRDILMGHFDEINCCAVSPDQQTLVTAGNDKSIDLWTLKKEESGESADLLQTLRGHTSGIQSCAFNPKGNMLLTCDSFGGVKTWDIEKGSKPLVVKNPFSFYQCAFDKTSEHIVTADGSGIQIRSSTTAEKIDETIFFNARTCIFYPEGDKVIAGNERGTVLVWDYKSGKKLNFKAHTITKEEREQNGKKSAEINWIDVSGKILATASDDYSIGLWNMNTFAKTKKPIRSLMHNAPVYCCDLSKDRKKIISATDNAVRIWNTANGKTLGFLAHGGMVHCCLFCQDDSLILAGGDEKDLRLWDFRRIRLFDLERKRWESLDNNERLKYLQEQFAVRNIPLKGNSVPKNPGPFQFLFECGNRQYSVIGKETPTCYISGTFVKLSGHNASVYCCAVSPDGKRFVSGGDDYRLHIWDAKKGAKLLADFDKNSEEIKELKPIMTLAGPTKKIEKCAFGPDGKTLISISDDHTMRIWNAPGFILKEKH